MPARTGRLGRAAGRSGLAGRSDLGGAGRAATGLGAERTTVRSIAGRVVGRGSAGRDATRDSLTIRSERTARTVGRCGRASDFDPARCGNSGRGALAETARTGGSIDGRAGLGGSAALDAAATACAQPARTDGLGAGPMPARGTSGRLACLGLAGTSRGGSAGREAAPESGRASVGPSEGRVGPRDGGGNTARAKRALGRTLTSGRGLPRSARCR
jgi:hypothetical protein